MGNARRMIGAIVGCVVLIGASCVFGEDWPQWRGINRDAKVSGFAAPTVWPKELKQKWQTTVGLGDATPALVGDKLFVFARQGDDEVVVCLNAANGEEIWRDKYPGITVTGAESSHPGPRSSPAVADGKVVTLGVSGVLSCYTDTGKFLWRKKDFVATDSPFYAAMSPVIVDGMCIAQLGKKDTGVLAAFDLNTGDIKWKAAEGDCPSFGSPVLMTVDGVKQIVALTEKRFVSVATADGKLLWEIPFKGEGRSVNATTPIVDGQTLIYTGASRGTKAVKIEKQGDSFKINEIWSSPIATTFNTPVLKDGLLYGISDKSKMFCLNAQNGQEAWTGEVNVGRFGSIIDAGSVLVALPEKTGLIVFKPSDKQYEEVAKIKVSDTQTYATPVLAGNRIFIKDKENVTLWTVE